MILLSRARIFLLACLSLFLCGCVNNGYISSTITTGIGLDVSENPQTQVPHVRFGYIRNGLYYIPTGKTGNRINGDASETPNVVSKIHMSSKFMEGLTISEKFAVGEDAVQSKGARQLFADVSTETRGTVPSVPVVSDGDTFEGNPHRKKLVVQEQPEVDPNLQKVVNTLNQRITPLTDTTAQPLLDQARMDPVLKDDFKTVPQGQLKAKKYLFRLIQQNSSGAKNGKAKLDAWSGIIPNPTSPPTPGN